MMPSDDELDAISNYGKYAVFLAEKAAASPKDDPSTLRDILTEASEYAHRSGNDDAMIAVANAWLGTLGDKRRAASSLIMPMENDDAFHCGSTWANNFRRLHNVLGDDAFPLILRKLPECEKLYPDHFLDWADNWSLLGIAYRDNSIRCIKNAESRAITDYLSGCIAFAVSYSKVPGKRNDSRIKYWLEQAENCAHQQDDEFLTMHLTECAWGWRDIYSKSQDSQHHRLFSEAEDAAHRPNDYFFLADFISEGGGDVTSHEERIAGYIEEAERLAQTKEDWMACSSIWGHFGDSPADVDRCWSRAMAVGI
jgi:hypothetical protein